MITLTTSSRDLYARDVLGWTTRYRMVKSDVERRLQDPFAELFPLRIFGSKGMASNKQEDRMSTTNDWREQMHNIGSPLPIARPMPEMAVAAPDDEASDGWAWLAAFLLGGGAGFLAGVIFGAQLAVWALAPEVAS